MKAHNILHIFNSVEGSENPNAKSLYDFVLDERLFVGDKVLHYPYGLNGICVQAVVIEVVYVTYSNQTFIKAVLDTDTK